MKSILFSENFNFNTLIYGKKHYTDNRISSPQHYIAYMESGSCKIVSENSTINIKTGDVFYIPKDLPYQSYWSSENEIKFKSYIKA